MNLLHIQNTLNEIVLKAGIAPKDYERYHNISDKIAPVMARKFISAVSKVQLLMNVTTLEEAIEKEKKIDSILDVIDWSLVLSSLQDAMRPGYITIVSEAGQLTQELLNKEFGIQLSFNVRNPHVQGFIEKEVGALIRDVAEQAKSTVKDIISDAFQYGGHPYETAVQIREYIGLTDSQYRMVRKRFQAMVDNGMPMEEAYAQSILYRDYLVKRRAEVIARTETIRAANGGQQVAWELAIAQLDGMQKKWIITPDDRLCASCQTIARSGPVDIDGTFADGVKHPPLHPNCRCAMGLVKKRSVEKFNSR